MRRICGSAARLIAAALCLALALPVAACTDEPAAPADVRNVKLGVSREDVAARTGVALAG